MSSSLPCSCRGHNCYSSDHLPAGPGPCDRGRHPPLEETTESWSTQVRDRSTAGACLEHFAPGGQAGAQPGAWFFLSNLSGVGNETLRVTSQQTKQFQLTFISCV